MQLVMEVIAMADDSCMRNPCVQLMASLDKMGVGILVFNDVSKLCVGVSHCKSPSITR